MNYTPDHDFFWHRLANDVYVTVRYYCSCAWKQQINNKKWKLRLLPPSKSLEYVAMYILIPLPRNRKPVHLCDTVPVFKVDETARDCSENYLGSLYDICRPLNIEFRLVLIDTYGQRSVVHIGVLLSRLCRASNNAADVYGASHIS